MDRISLGTTLIHVWAFLTLAGCAAAPAITWSLPLSVRALVLGIGGIAALGAAGLASIALDPSPLTFRLAAWGVLIAIAGTHLTLRRRGREGGRARPAATTLNEWLRTSALSLSLLLAFAYAAHLMSLAGAPPYSPALSWRVMTMRSYPLMDGDLQYLVADAFLDDRGVEKHFYDRGFLWSAGDRPMALAVLVTAAAKLTGSRELTSYRLVVVLFACFSVLAVFALLSDVMAIRAGPSLLLTAVFALHPFFLTNIEFTWPKMTGAGMALAGFVLAAHALSRVEKEGLRATRGLLLLGGVGLGMAPVFHGTLIVGLLCLLAILIVIRWDALSGAPSKHVIVALLVGPWLVFHGLQAHYITHHTQSSNLGVRVALCREGSFMRPSPAMSLGEACRRYVDRVGIAGILDDRRMSLRQAFVVGFADFQEPYSGVHRFSDFQRAYARQTLHTPVYAMGLFALPLLALSGLACTHRRGRRRLADLREPLALLALGTLFLALFAAMMGEWPEVKAFQIPMTQTMLIFLGAWGLLYGLAPRATTLAAALYLAFCISIFANDAGVFGVTPRAEVLAWGAVCFVFAFLLAAVLVARDQLDMPCEGPGE